MKSIKDYFIFKKKTEDLINKMNHPQFKDAKSSRMKKETFRALSYQNIICENEEFNYSNNLSYVIMRTGFSVVQHDRSWADSGSAPR